MMFLAFCMIVLSVYNVHAEQKCQGWPRRYNGKSCASTTNYYDQHKGACGCGPSSNDNQFGWNHDKFVAAASEKYFDQNSKSWCGQHCGQCIKLTPTGGFVPGQGSAPTNHGGKVFMITNECPNVAPNTHWCNQRSQYGSHNDYGYEVHFDLEDGANQIKGMGWNNPEVTWEVVNCDQAHNHDRRTPSYSMWGQCQCAHQGKRDTNATIV